MSKRKRTYVDAGVLIAAAKGSEDISEEAIHVLADPFRDFASSAFVKLEVLPKATFYKQSDEVLFYNTFFDSVEFWADDLQAIVTEAQRQAETFDIGAIDALHVAAAISVGADELVTSEKPTKPINRATAIKIVSLYGLATQRNKSY